MCDTVYWHLYMENRIRNDEWKKKWWFSNTTTLQHQSTKSFSCLHGDIFLILRQKIKKLKQGEFNSNLHVVQIQKVTHVVLTVAALKNAKQCFLEMDVCYPMTGKNRTEISVSLDGEKERQESCRTVSATQYFSLSFLCQIQPHWGSPSLTLSIWKALWSRNILYKC